MSVLVAASVGKAVGVLLLVAGAAKLLEGLERLTSTIEQYRIVSGRWAWCIARVLPWVEVLLGTLMVGGLLMPWTAYATSGLLVAFAGVVSLVMIRGLRGVRCGCFGALGSQDVGWAVLARNLVLATGTAFVGLTQSDLSREIGFGVDTGPWEGLPIWLLGLAIAGGAALVSAIVRMVKLEQSTPEEGT